MTRSEAYMRYYEQSPYPDNPMTFRVWCLMVNREFDRGLWFRRLFG